MRGTTHQLEAGGERLLVTVCTTCESDDPGLRAIPHSGYLGVMHGLHRIDECHHPRHVSERETLAMLRDHFGADPELFEE